MLLGGFMQRPYLGAGIPPLAEDFPRPWKPFIGIEIAPEDDHQIDELADIPLDSDVVCSRALDPVLDRFAKPQFARGSTLLREELPQVGQHPFLELLHLQLRKDCELCLPNRQHRRSAPKYVTIHPPAIARPAVLSYRERLDFMIPLGDTGFALCFWHEMGRMDRNQALSLLRRSKSDIWAQASLRSVVAKRSAPTTLTRFSDDQVLEAVADLIASGELVLVRTGDHVIGRKGDTVLGGGAKSAAPPPPAARPASQSVAPPPPVDARVYSANVDPVAQAAVNQQAAQQGAPFCEE